jgi:peptide/nickel transport system permease protein
MPAFVLGNAIAGVIMRHTRSAMLQALQSDYVRTARAKGLAERVVVLKHAMRNALTPVITWARWSSDPALGAVLTEQIFTIPGFGKLIVDAVFNRDYAVVQGVVLVTATTYIALNLLADVGYILVNPSCVHDGFATAAPALPSDSDRTESPGRRAWRRLLRRRGAVAGLAVIAIIAAAAILAPLISPYDPTQQSWSAVRKAPSAAHWFGTDEVGRDLLARIIYGARASLSAGVISVAIAIAVGVPLGLLAGYAGGLVDGLLSRITDAMLACPFLILAIALAAFLGPSLSNAMIAIGVTATPLFVRLTRGQVLSVKSEDFVEAARAVGNPHWRIAARHILPNVCRRCSCRRR